MVLFSMGDETHRVDSVSVVTGNLVEKKPLPRVKMGTTGPGNQQDIKIRQDYVRYL